MKRHTRAAGPAGKDAASWFAVILLSLLSASRANGTASPVAVSGQTDFEATRLLLLELWPRVLVAANVDTAEIGTSLDVQFVTGGPPLALSRERTRPGFVLQVNRGFVAENDRLIEGLLVANRVNLQDMFRSFALDRAVALAAAGTGAAPPVKTFNEFIGWSAEGFAYVRGQASFREAAGAARRQGFAWLLARVVIQSRLPLREGARQPIDNPYKRAARVTFEVSASPFPPLPTGLLTAALEPPGERASVESIACAMAGWLATGITIMQALPDFSRRMERDTKLQRSMEGVSKDMGQLRDRGRCATPL